MVSLLAELKKSDVNKDEVIKAFVSKVEAIIKEKCQQQENVKEEPSATASTQTKCGILRHLLNRIKEMMKGDEGAQKERFVKALTAAQDNLKTIGEDAPLVVSLLAELKKSDVNKDEVIKAFVSKVEAIIKEKCQQQENVKVQPSATASTRTKCGILRHLLNHIKEMMKKGFKDQHDDQDKCPYFTDKFKCPAEKKFCFLTNACIEKASRCYG